MWGSPVGRERKLYFAVADFNANSSGGGRPKCLISCAELSLFFFLFSPYTTLKVEQGEKVSTFCS